MNQFRVTSGQKEMISAAEDYADTVNYFLVKNYFLVFFRFFDTQRRFCPILHAFSLFLLLLRMDVECGFNGMINGIICRFSLF